MDRAEAPQGRAAPALGICMRARFVYLGRRGVLGPVARFEYPEGRDAHVGEVLGDGAPRP